MLSQSSPGKLLKLSLLLLLLRGVSSAQTPETVLASVNGVEITQKQVDQSVAGAIYPLQQQLYALRKVALENLVTATILETEAKARGLPVDELRRQLTLGEIQVTRAQVEEAYTQNASFFAAMSPDEAKERLRLDLENQARMKHYRARLETLRKNSIVRLNLPPPMLTLELDDGASPTRGSAKPAVTIVEFSDFECPFSAQVQTTLREIVDRYGSEVRLIFKHLPSEGHRNSLAAARAAFCAGEQDRFWQFHDALFASQNLSPGVFHEIAAGLGLNLARFEECSSSEQSRTAIIKDLEMARRFRVDSTPSFLINGNLIKGALTPGELQSIIERELNQHVTLKQSSTN